MAAFLVMLFALVVSRSQAGYLYPRPLVPFELPIEKNLKIPPVGGESINQLHKVAVSYTVPIEDYKYLKQHKNNYLNLPNNNQIIGNNEGSLVLEKLVAQSDNVISNVAAGAVGQVSIVNQDYDNTAVVQQAIKQTASIDNNEFVSINKAPIVNQFANGNQLLTQNVIQQQLAPVEPRVTKHIYFHVPPPDVDEQPVYRVPEPPKKIYKIIFVKVPSQEASYNAQIQQIIQARLNQNAPVEDKTLIYVLVKKPETVEVLPPPPPTPSAHEVLFVKYSDNGAGAPVPNVSPQGNFLFDPKPILQAGPQNGHS